MAFEVVQELVVVRLIHPERQANELIRLFEGGPASHPAAALAAWKRASPKSGKLGKLAEALIRSGVRTATKEAALAVEAQ